MSVIDKPGFYTSKAGKCEVVAVNGNYAIGWTPNGCFAAWFCDTGSERISTSLDITGPWPPEPRKPVECWGVAFDDGEVLPKQFKEDAEESLRNWTEGDGDHCGARLIHLREVEDEKP